MSVEPRGGPLAGVRVVELTRVWAGPFAGKLLAFLGAEVIKIESLDSLDASRVYGPSTLDIAAGFQAVNPQKLSAQLNLREEEGCKLLLELLAKTDILIDNMRPGVMARLGLGYDVIKDANPGLIYVAMSLYGGKGPLSYQTGYAVSFVAAGGVTNMVGYEGEQPTGMNIRYGDSTFGAAAAFSAAVALLHKQRTGTGQHIDIAAAETMSTMIGDVVMDYALNGKVQGCDGNRHSEMAPHGAYPCLADDWISIAVRDDDEWRALAECMGEPALADLPKFRTLADRQAHVAELDDRIVAWTAKQDAGALAALLQKHGIAAAKSQNTIDLCADDRLWSHGLFRVVKDTAGQDRPTVGPSWRMKREARITHGAPQVGEHNPYVFGEILGLSEDEQQRLAEAGVMR